MSAVEELMRLRRERDMLADLLRAQRQREMLPPRSLSSLIEHDEVREQVEAEKVTRPGNASTEPATALGDMQAAEEG